MCRPFRSFSNILFSHLKLGLLRKAFAAKVSYAVNVFSPPSHFTIFSLENIQITIGAYIYFFSILAATLFFSSLWVWWFIKFFKGMVPQFFSIALFSKKCRISNLLWAHCVSWTEYYFQQSWKLYVSCLTEINNHLIGWLLFRFCLP